MSETSSLRRRPGRVCRLFRCHQCLRTVRIIASPGYSVFCPRCYGRFLHELDVPRPRLPIDYVDPAVDPSSPFPNFLDYLSAALGLSDSWVIFREPGPAAGGHPALPIGWRDLAAPPLAVEVTPGERAIPPTVQPGDYFTGPGLSELIEGLTQNDRPGPPAAPASAIDAMPTVTIEDAHLVEGSQCPVCKEDFGLGEEAREMPCKHVYHSDCIVPWLQAHNSCPVCRLPLPAGDPLDGEDCQREGEDEGQRGAAGAGGRHRRFRWNPFTVLWPFRSSSSTNWGNNGRRHQEMDEDGIDGNGAGWASEILSLVPVLCLCAAFGSWWRSWFLL